MRYKTDEDNKVAKWALTLSGPVLAILTFLVSYYIDPFSFGNKQPLAALPAFLFAIIVLIISHILTINAEIKKRLSMLT